MLLRIRSRHPVWNSLKTWCRADKNECQPVSGTESTVCLPSTALPQGVFSALFVALNRIWSPHFVTARELLPSKNRGHEMKCKMPQVQLKPETVLLISLMGLNLNHWVELPRLKDGNLLQLNMLPLKIPKNMECMECTYCFTSLLLGTISNLYPIAF